MEKNKRSTQQPAKQKTIRPSNDAYPITRAFLQEAEDLNEAHRWLGAGLRLALSFGEDWLQPIQGRLAVLFPQLSVAQLETISEVCQEVKQFSESWLQKEAGKHSEEVYAQAWRAAMMTYFPWLSEQELGHLFSQGVYYARK